MFKTIREILRTGNATIGYPFEALERPQYARGKPEHDNAQCIACGACAVACPPNALQMVIDPKGGTTTWSINYGRCIFCGRCEEVCPTKAIELSEEFELAVFDKNDLEETCTFALQSCSECGKYYAPAKEVAYARSIVGQAASTDAEASRALALLGVCPTCKQRADAYRAMRRIETVGDPTQEPTPEQMEEARRIAEQNKREAAR